MLQDEEEQQVGEKNRHIFYFFYSAAMQSAKQRVPSFLSTISQSNLTYQGPAV
jgi:hypothetical protein